MKNKTKVIAGERTRTNGKHLKWSEMFPDGRHIYYEGDDPKGFVEQIKAEFGFDPSKDEHWGNGCCFHCPPEHLDAIYSGRFPMGS